MMNPFEAWRRKYRGRYQRVASLLLGRRPFRMNLQHPIISFTFDDFPRSSLSTGGGILEDHGATGTYYASLGLMGTVAPTGEIFTKDDLISVRNRGHELGCHTYAHCHASETSAADFEISILENRRAMLALELSAPLETLSYPIGCPRPSIKRKCAHYFSACRAGGQHYNSGLVDLNSLRAFFLEQCRDDPTALRNIIHANSRNRGWLIFATHDVSDRPTRFGCQPGMFEEVVRHSIASGAQILPVAKALESLGVPKVSVR